MAEELLLEAEFESASNPPYGFLHIVSPAQFVLQAGAEYRVVYDGVEYDCTGIDVAALGDGAVGIGNGAASGLPGNGEPFSFVTFDGAAIVVCLIDTEPTQHSIAVYKTVKESGLVTENYDGSQIVHPGVETVSLYNTEGGIEMFVHDSLVAEPVETTVDVDWSGGDMIVTPEAGKVFSKILLPKPETAIPDNIRDGVNLSGILGAMKAGSGGGGDLVGEGKFISVNNNGDKPTISHNLGVIPDLVIAYTLNLTANYPFVILASNRISFPTQNTSPANTAIVYTGTGVSTVGESGGNGIESADSTCLIYGATDSTISIGGTGLGKGFWILYFIGRAT